MNNYKISTFAIIFGLISLINSHNVCYKEDENCNLPEKRYLFYDINFPEGFNLRRDVYVRFAVLLHELRKSKNPLLNNLYLVLPPWTHLVHWKSTKNAHFSWNLYFDIESLKKFAPVIEIRDFFKEYSNKYSNVVIDVVYTLQHFEEMFENGIFEEKMNITKCQKTYQHTFFFYNNITSNSFHCVSYHGAVTNLKELFLKTEAKSILIEHAEIALHSVFGNKLYWKARRSMRFNTHLKDIAADFRKTYLNSTNEKDNIVIPTDWLKEKPHRNAVGGPYLGIHLRRRDFLRSRPNESPSILAIAGQVEHFLKILNLKKVFVATDGTNEELDELVNLLTKYEVHKYVASKQVSLTYGDGGIAIIEQIICSHARYFIGTHESTFSFRIQEEREILGFPTKTTFNVFCNDNKKCPKPSVWKIMY